MSREPIFEQQRRENPEPDEGRRPVPWFMLILIALVTAFGVVYITRQSDIELSSALGDGRDLAELRGKVAEAGSAVDGAAVYASLCVACHQASGQGLPGVFPPLAGSEWVNGKEATLASIVLHGVTDKITVRGVAYNGAMPAFKEQLNDAQLAAVLTHLRSQWGNSAEPVSAETVAKVRAATADRTASFKGEAELGPAQ